MAETKVSIKLLVDTKANKVLFAEASKDFIDYLLHILSLPIGTVIKILSSKSMVGCLGDLYQSVETLNTDYLQPNFKVDSLLNPSSSEASGSVPLLLGDSIKYHSAKKFYSCPHNYNHRFVSDSPSALCPTCRSIMSSEIPFVAPTVSSSAGGGVTLGGGGYVKGVVTYMVMDNLEVKPMSTISGITLITKFNVKDVSCLAEKQVQVSLNEGIALLKASLETRAVLSAVFLSNKL